MLTDCPEQKWWLGMAHFYLAINHLLAGDFERALGEATRANHEVAVAACRRSLELAPDRVSRAYATLFLGFALLEKGEAEEARAQLEPIVTELEGFALRQWHALAATLTGESLRMLGRFDEAAAFAETGLRVATEAAYWYAVGFGHRVVARIKRDRGASDRGRAGFEQALAVFARIGATFEADRTRADLARLEPSERARF